MLPYFQQLGLGVSLQSLPGYILISEKIGHMKALEATITITLAAWQENLSNDLKIMSNNGPQAKMHLQPATWLTGKSPSKRMSRHYWPSLGVVTRHNSAPQWGGGGLSIGNWVWPKGDIVLFPGGKQIVHSSCSRHQIPSDTMNCLFPNNTFLPRTYYFSKSPSQQKFAWRADILRNRSIGCPWALMPQLMPAL